MTKEEILQRIYVVREMQSQILPLLNKISSSAWFVGQGKVHKSREVEDTLTSWSYQYNGILPDYVVNEIRGLSIRVTDWIMNQGTIATPHNFATDKNRSFHSLRLVLQKYNEELYSYFSKIKDEGVVVMGEGNIVFNNSTINGNIYDSFKIINSKKETATDKELNEVLEELTHLVQKLIQELPANKGEETSRDLKALIEEVKSEKPRRKWYELSADGLIDAAKFTGNFATAISGALSKIMALLG